PLGYHDTADAGEDDAIAVDSTGRALAANTGFFGTDHPATVLRYGTDGFGDPSFHGQVTIAGYDLTAKAVAVAPNDDVVLAGEADNGSVTEAFVARVTAAGSLDTTGFNPAGGTPGVVHLPINVNGGFGGVAVQGDGA